MAGYDFHFSPRQQIALALLIDVATQGFPSTDLVEVLYGGAKYGGKSVFLCYYAVLYALRVMQLYRIAGLTYPLAIGYLGRKRGVDFSDTTLETFKRFIPPEIFTINKQSREIVIAGQVKYDFGGMDSEEAIRKFNSAEYGFVGIDQAEELSEDDAGMVRQTIRLAYKGRPLPRRILWTANPGPGWLKRDFVDNPATRLAYRHFVRALPTDNIYGDAAGYVTNLRAAFHHRPELIKAYVDGNWDSGTDFDFVFRGQWVDDARRVKPRIYPRDKILVSCDPARYGDDETVIYTLCNEQIINAQYRYNQSTMETAGQLLAEANRVGAGLIVVDSIGLGAGVVDRCVELCKNSDVKVLGVNSASLPDWTIKGAGTEAEVRAKYLNLRAQMWWAVAEQMSDGQLPMAAESRELCQQLQGVKYEIRNGKIKIEDKDDVKQRLGKSPDRADCYVQGIWALSKCDYQGFDAGELPQMEFKNRKGGYG